MSAKPTHSSKKNPLADPSSSLQQALAWLQAGDAHGAALLFGSLVSNPALRLSALAGLGRAQRALGQFDMAIQSCQRALDIAPQSPALMVELAMAQRAAGQAEAAEQTYRRALTLAPQDAAIHHNLGNLLQARGAHEEAVACFRQAVSLQPDMAPAWLNLGYLLCDARPTEAEQALKRGMSLGPKPPQALAMLAKLLANGGLFNDAEQCARMAIQLDAQHAPGYHALGLALRVGGRMAEAVNHLAQATRLSTDHDLVCEALYLRALCQKDMGTLTAAQASAQALLDQCQTPHAQAKAHQLLGALHFDAGDTPAALEHYHRSMDLTPDAVSPRVTFCATTNYAPDFDAAAQLAFARRLIGPLARPETLAPHTNDRDPHRPLRVGYLSGDFKWHSCAYFLLPLLTHHDRTRFELHAYATEPTQDAMTLQLKGLFHHWRRVHHLDPTELARQIRDDRIDILIDVSGLTDGGRIEALALKPAPVQISWLGYLGTTGLSTVDHRLTDRFMDAPGLPTLSTESPLRLPGHYLCFEPPNDAPPPAHPPCRDHITFGSFNALSKLSEACVALWSDVLLAVPASRLLLKTRALADEAVKRQTLARFALRGVAPERLELRGWQETTASHLEAYAEIDIALDTTPYNGVTTTCEAAWQGVPVVSLVGDTYASRQGLTLLTALGLADHAATSPAAFVAKCSSLAADLPGLRQLRSELRPRMARGPLTQGAEYAAQVEAAYRQAWHQWCGLTCGSPDR